MDIEKEVYHSNGILGLIPLVDDSEAISFQFGKLITSDSKDFFNCDTTIGLEYPVRPALQPICVHVDGAESTNWVNPPCDDNVDLLDISSKRLPVDLGLNNGLDKSSIYSSFNGSIYSSSNLTPNNHVISNSLPSSSEIPSETTDYYYGNSIQQHQHSEIYINNNSSSSSSSGMRGDYGNHGPLVDNEKIYYNGYYSQQQQQNYDHLNHHHVNHISSHNHHHHHQIYHNHHHQQQTTTTTPLHHFHSKRGQQPFQRHHTHRRRLNLYEKSSPSPTKLKNKHQQQQPQSPPEAQKPQKPQKPPKSQKSSVIQQRSQKVQKSQDQQPTQSQLPQTKPQQKIIKNRLKKLFHGKSLEAKQELNSRVVLKRKIGRPRKLDQPKKPAPKFRSHRLRLKVQSEEGIYSDEVSQPSDGPPDSEVKVEVKEKKVKEVLPCNWVRPDDLSFDRETVSDYEKASLPEFFAGKFDRTHFHPSQYLQIRNIFFDEWEKRKPNAVNFREMIRAHKGIGNVVSFSRVCKFLTAIGAINEISQDDDDNDKEEEENDASKTITPENVNKQQHDDNQSKSQYKESEELKDPQSNKQSSSPCRVTNGSSSTTSSPLPPTSSSSTTTKTQSEVTSQPKRKGRKRKSYFLNEMTRLGIDPLSAGFPIPNCDKEEEEDKESREEGDGEKDENCEQTTSSSTSTTSTSN